MNLYCEQLGSGISGTHFSTDIFLDTPLFMAADDRNSFYYFPTPPTPPFISRFQYTGDRTTDHNKKGPGSRRKWFFISLFFLSIYGILFFTSLSLEITYEGNLCVFFKKKPGNLCMSLLLPVMEI